MGRSGLLIHATQVGADAFVGTEHVLLAMTRQSNDAFARRLLDDVGATEALQTRIEAIIGEG